MAVERQEMHKTIIAFRARGGVLTELTKRSRPTLSASQVAQRDLTTYYALLREELPTFTFMEAWVLAEAAERLEPSLHDAHCLIAVLMEHRRRHGDSMGRDRLSALASVIAILSHPDTTDFRCLAILDALSICRNDREIYNAENFDPEYESKKRFQRAGLI